MRKRITPIFLSVGIFFGGLSGSLKALNVPDNTVLIAQGAVLPQLNNLNISNLPFCDVPLKNLLQIVNQARQTSGGLEPVYNFLTILYYQKKAEYQSGKSSLDPDQVDYCRFKNLEEAQGQHANNSQGNNSDLGELEIPIRYFDNNDLDRAREKFYRDYLNGYYKNDPRKFYFFLTREISYLGKIGKMVVSAEGNHALIRSINGVPLNIRLYFNPPDIKVTKNNLLVLLSSQFSLMLSGRSWTTWLFNGQYYAKTVQETFSGCQLPSAIRNIIFIEPLYKAYNFVEGDGPPLVTLDTLQLRGIQCSQ